MEEGQHVFRRLPEILTRQGKGPRGFWGRPWDVVGEVWRRIAGWDVIWNGWEAVR